MKALVTDLEVLASLRPLDLVAYLRAHGWKQRETADDDPLSEWSKDSERGYYELQVPRHGHWKDYARRIRDVVAVLAEEEARSQIELVTDIPFVARDVIRVRCVVQGRTDGTISLDDGAHIATAARSMMLAAACSTVEPRRAWGSRKPQQAIRYLDDVSLGQTERGSFVLTLLAPVPPSLIQPALGSERANEDEPFNRRVTRTLGTALTAVRRAAELGVSTGDLSVFEAGVDDGISADLCEALALVRERSSVTQLEVRIGWASARPPREPPAALHDLAPDVLEVIREAGRVLRERTPVEDFEVEGPVVKVHRPGAALLGDAVVLGAVNGRPCQVHISVGGEEWTTTMQAMAERAILRCRGELVREGKRYLLRNVRDLRIVPTDE
ncbi:MAG TPA: hypothetical protein VNO30_04565 [Kofleriaceae bacterium]|nr:hypothetical protein [Kofleriaceae bacterium]